ncbi:MAG: hypothetical protein D8B51_02210, partial [Tannerella sp.]
MTGAKVGRRPSVAVTQKAAVRAGFSEKEREGQAFLRGNSFNDHPLELFPRGNSLTDHPLGLFLRGNSSTDWWSRLLP